MEKMRNVKTEKLNRIVCIRMSDDDYYALLQISRRNQSKVSKIIRMIVSNVIYLIPKNNT